MVNVTDFGLFIDIYNGLEGLAHISEIDVPAAPSWRSTSRWATGVRTRILRIEEEEKKVGLSMRGVSQPTEEELAELQASVAKLGDEGEARGRKAEADKESESEEAEE